MSTANEREHMRQLLAAWRLYVGTEEDELEDFDYLPLVVARMEQLAAAMGFVP